MLIGIVAQSRTAPSIDLDVGEGVGTATGVGDAAGAGLSLASATGASSGTGTATATGASTAIADGAASGTSTASAAYNTSPLDGLTTTGAWSMSRKLYDTYTANGGAFYHTTSSNVDTLYDQSGNSRNMTDGGSAARRPAVTTAGPNSIACADFDGSSDYLSGAAISNFIANNSGYMIISCLIDVVTLNSATPYQNDILFGDSGQFMGLYLRNNGPNAYGFNWDGNADSNSTGFSTGVPVIIEWRHESGTVYVTVDGTEVSAVSGNTSTMTGTLNLFGRGTQYANGKFFEAAVFSTVPDAATRQLIRSAFGDYVGSFSI